MPESDSSSIASDKHQSSSSSSLKAHKRKLSSSAVHSYPDQQSPLSTTAQSKQQQSTITSLFTSTSSKPPSDNLATSSKRLKSKSPSGVFTPIKHSTTANTAGQSMPSTENNVVDLTKSRTPVTAGKTPMNRALPTVFSSKNGARKLVVKNLRQTSRTVPESYVEKTWGMLDQALTAIFDETKVSFTMEELYRGTENLCRAEKAAYVHEKLKKRCEQHVSGPMKAALLERSGRSEQEVVKVVDTAWAKWCKQLGVIRSIFFYLDRSYLLSSKLLSIWEMGLQMFSSHMVTINAIQSKFFQGIFALFERDRKVQIDPESASLLLSSIRMVSSLNLYSTAFQPKFLEFSEHYYQVLAKEESTASSIAKFINECALQIDREIERCDKYNLESITKRELITIIETEMIQKNMDLLNNKDSIADLIDKKNTNSLATLYSLINRVEIVGDALSPAWTKYVLGRGGTIVADQEREPEMVTRLLDLKSSLDKIWKDCFRKNDVLGNALRKSFEIFINEQRKGSGYEASAKPAEMIAKYIDLLLRNGVKALTSVANSAGDGIEKEAGIGDEDAELASQMEQVLDLFRFIQGKDVFEAFYKRDLARRLLMGRSASSDAERSMLSKLKNECGSQFTLNLEIMFKDIDLSKESIISFKNSKAGHEKAHGVDLSVNVLSQAAWPGYAETKVTLPVKLAEHLQSYQDFYNSTHNGRKLMWRHALAHCVIKAEFPKGKKELVVSAFQAVVLLLFNESEVLTYEYIRDATSLACGKFRVLAKSPKGRDVNAGDKFAVNKNFHDPKFRIKINQIQLKETKAENKATHEQVTQDRQYETQAAIIRIMKSRKTVKHVDLIQQVIEQTKKRGMLDAADIKKNIERLIDKDYMERKEGNTYSYVA